MLTIIQLSLATVLYASLMSSSAADEQDELDKVLNETTEIATKTRLNIDHVPGTLTIISGDELRTRGLSNIGQALNNVTGMRFNVSGSMVAVRGISAFSSGKVLIMINNVPVNESLLTLGSPIFMLPLDMVERIEVIRGTSSAVHGEYAFNGTINIVTDEHQDHIWTAIGSNNTRVAGLTYSVRGPMEFHAAISKETTDGIDVILKSDTLHGTRLSNAPGPINDKREATNFIGSMYNKDLRIDLIHIYRGIGDGYGLANMLPPDNKHIVNMQSIDVLSAQYKSSIGRIKSVTDLYFLEYDYENENMFVGPAHLLTSSPLYTSFGATEHKVKFGQQFTYDNHTLGLSAARSVFDDIHTSTTWNPITFAATSMTTVPNGYDWVVGGQRDVRSAWYQYLFNHNELTVVSNIRNDSYSDIGSVLTYRIGSSYVLDKDNVIKLEAGTGYRPPSWLEKYSNNFIIHGDPHLAPETIAGVELGLVHKSNGFTSKTNIFKSKLDRLINLKFVGPIAHVYANMTDVSMYGIEQDISTTVNDFKLDLGVSAVHATDLATNSALAASSKYGLLFSVTYGDELKVNVTDRYNSSFARAVNDNRKSGGQNVLDLTATYSIGSWKIVGTVQNVFDTSITEYGGPASAPDDYPIGPRTLLLKTVYFF